MKTITLTFFLVSAIGLMGCSGSAKKPTAQGPVPGMVNMKGLSTDQKIQKIQQDKSIPENYKQTYINSLKSQGGAH